VSLLNQNQVGWLRGCTIYWSFNCRLWPLALGSFFFHVLLRFTFQSSDNLWTRWSGTI